jgi:hypothetical protein
VIAAHVAAGELADGLHRARLIAKAHAFDLEAAIRRNSTSHARDLRGMRLAVVERIQVRLRRIRVDAVASTGVCPDARLVFRGVDAVRRPD